MSYSVVSILIPSHTLDDFPTDCREAEAEGLLNAFAVSFHPALLAQTGQLPTWDRADLPPEDFENRLFIIPTVSAKLLPTAWMRRATEDGATVIANVDGRTELLERVLAECEPTEPFLDEDLVPDFFALGICRLMIQLLTRQMHHFSDQDETHLEKKAVLAAQALAESNLEEVRKHLRVCFELLLEERERLYPVESHLVELCLLIPRLADEHLQTRLENDAPFSLFISASDLEQIASNRPELVALLRERIASGTVDIVGGDWTERETNLLPPASSIWQLNKGRASYHSNIGDGAKTWGRRKFGLSSNIPQLASRSGIPSAVLFALDDGTYPDEEQGKIEWEGRDGNMVNAVSRLPLSIDSAANMLKFPERLADSMNHDYVAMLSLARWPKTKSPWLGDLYRIATYEPVLGRFTTLGEFLSESDQTGHMYSHDQRDYLTPFLSQSAASSEDDPISRYTRFYSLRETLNTAQWCSELTRLIKGLPEPDGDQLAQLSDRLEELGASPDPVPTTEIDNESQPLLKERLDQFSALIVAADDAATGGDGAAKRAGDHVCVVVNSQSFERTTVVELPAFEAPPAVEGPVKQIQFDGTRKLAVVTVPPCGFAGLVASGTELPTRTSETPLAEEFILRNEFFEVGISEQTGGIIQIKNYGRSPNRLSQQIAMRFADEKRVGETDETTQYSVMEAQHLEVTSIGPVLGQIVSTGVLKSPDNGEVIADFEQTTSVFRSVRDIDVRLKITPRISPAGNPWLEYYCARFAWDSASAVLTGGIQGNAFTLGHDRVEAPDYIEIADADQRMTIIPYGRPFHRRIGLRMLDSILIPAGEREQEFRFSLAFDDPFPMHAAKRVLSPVVCVEKENARLRGPVSGWMFRLSARNVILNRIFPPAVDVASSESPATGNKAIVELMETEGQHQSVKLRCFRAPKSARQINFVGDQLTSLHTSDDAIMIEAGPYEIIHVEIEF